jgi:hypothetical protein
MPAMKKEGAIMRILLSLLLAGILALWIPASAQNPRPSFSIVITTDNPVVKAGSDVLIKIQMKNISNHDMDCTMAPANGLDRKYRYDIRDAQGRPAVKVSRSHPELESGSIFPCTLKPGESTPAVDNSISWIYDFTRPGKYLVQVSRDDSKEGLAKSNKITLTVQP